MEETILDSEISIRKPVRVQSSQKNVPVKSSKSIKDGPQPEQFELLQKQWDVEMGVVNSKKIQVVVNNRSQANKIQQSLSQSIKIKAFYSCGGLFFQGLEIFWINPNKLSSYRCQKVKSFPSSLYKIINQQGSQRKQFQLCSNLMGTRYDLKNQGKAIMTILYDAQLNIEATCRHVNIFALKIGSSWDKLFGTNQTSDLKELYSKHHNFENLVNLTNIEPIYNPKTGGYFLKFGKKNIVRSEKNSLIANLNGQKLMQFYQTCEENTYQVNKVNRMPELWVIAYVISSLDFKLAVQ